MWCFLNAGTIQRWKNMKKGKKKGGCLKVVLTIVAVFVVLGIIGAVTGGGEDSSQPSKKTEAVLEKDTKQEDKKTENKESEQSAKSEVAEEISKETEQTQSITFGYNPESYTGIEANTSEMVDSISSSARAAANYSASEDNLDYCLNFIREKFPDYFLDNATMEEAMYCGYYLEYAYMKNGSENLYANLGMDVYQAVKYVYRGTESVEDDHVQENINQIKEALNKIGIEVSSDNAETVAPIVETDTSQQETVEKMVWIPESGSKYHNKSSYSGMNNPQQVTLSEAESLGFTPCKKCH